MKYSPATLRTAHQRGAAGFSLIEAMVAVAIIGIALGALMTLNGHQLRMVKMSKDTNAATLYQQERIEQLRQARWPDLASSNYIKTTFMAERPSSKAALDQISETITISPYPTAVNGGKSLSVAQAPGASPVVDSTLNGLGLLNERLVKVDMTLAWKGADGRGRQRSMTTLISNSGVTRSNLPALGPVSGGPWTPYGGGPGSGDTTGGTTGGDTGGTTGGTTGGDTGGTTGGTTGGDTGGTTGNGNGNGNGGTGGNGNGRGNTGGKGGKG